MARMNGHALWARLVRWYEPAMAGRWWLPVTVVTALPCLCAGCLGVQSGWTALKKAALNGHELVVDYLLDNGAFANVPEADKVEYNCNPSRRAQRG